MNRGKVGEERGGKEMDGCSLTMTRQINLALTFLPSFDIEPCFDIEPW
jgi:hypothetical protein